MLHSIEKMAADSIRIVCDLVVNFSRFLLTCLASRIIIILIPALIWIVTIDAGNRFSKIVCLLQIDESVRFTECRYLYGPIMVEVSR